MDEMRETCACVNIKLIMRQGEDIAAAKDRLRNLLHDSLCTLADHHVEFEIESMEET